MQDKQQTVGIVGVMKLVNANNRRDFRADEYDLYDVKKARPYWNQVCAANEWEIIKNDEDFGEDFVCKIIDDIFMYEYYDDMYRPATTMLTTMTGDFSRSSPFLSF